MNKPTTSPIISHIDMTSQHELQKLLTKEMLEYEYAQCGSMRKMAKKLHLDIDTISRYMKLHDVKFVPHYNGLYDCNETIFSEETERSFYLAGFIAADGSVQYRQHSKVLKIALSIKDKMHLEMLRKLFDSNHPISTYTVKSSNGNTSQDVEMSIVSNMICDDLLKFNVVPNKTATYTFPIWLSQHPLVKHFMRGYVDGDGCFTFHKEEDKSDQLIFQLRGTYSFLETFAKILQKQVTAAAHNRVKTYDSTSTITYSGNIIAKSIHDYLYEDATIYLDRKRNIQDKQHFV